MSDLVSTVSRMISRAALAVSVAGLTLMTLIIGWQVFARYVLNASPSWSEQAALLLMLYFLLFAAAVGIREGFHIRIVLLEESLPARMQAPLQCLQSFLIGLFGLAMAAGGYEMMFVTASHTIPTLGISRAWSYVPMTAAGGLIVFYACEQLLARFTGREVERLWN